MSLALQTTIDQAWENRANLSPSSAPAEIRQAVGAVLEGLNNGSIRVAQRQSVGQWNVNQWVKKAVLLSFRLEDNQTMSAGGFTQFYDKVPSKFANYTPEDFAKGGFRVVPPAFARRGSYVAKNVVLMPSYVNIGAYVDEGTMVDIWATVGSCAQIGKNVHLSGGVGIGGVLEPIQAGPVIIEDTALLAHAPKWSKVLSLKKTACSQWVSILVKAPRSMTARPARSTTAECHQAQWWSRAQSLLVTVSTVYMLL